MSKPVETVELPVPITHVYGEHVLQTLTAWPLHSHGQQEPATNKKYWIIYIHGGAWRDPLITNLSFIPVITVLLNATNRSTTLAQVAGFASIDYRLSAHPNFPQDPTTTPVDEFRNAHHPDHINDVLTALQVLQSAYGFEQDYVLVGHSCGATLSFQTIMQANSQVHPPSALLGVCGIYDIPLILKNHASSPYHQIYEDFVIGAFGLDEEVWKQQSPRSYKSFEEWQSQPGRVVILASSEEDELVEAEQLEVMYQTLSVSVGVKPRRMTHLRGAHNEVFNKGVGLAEVIKAGLAGLIESGVRFPKACGNRES